MMKKLALACSLATLAHGVCNAAEVVVGSELALTGAYAFAGAPSREGMMLALDEINAQKLAGAHTIKLVIEDTASEKQQAIALINRLASRDNAVLVLGPSSSPEGVAIAPIANSIKVPMLTPTGLADDISKAGPWSFRTATSSNPIVDATVAYSLKTGGAKRVALVYLRDNESQINNKNLVEAAYKAGGAAVESESVLTTDTDYQAILTKFLSKPIDTLFVSLSTEPSANFIIQARQAGLDDKIKIVGGATMGSGRFLAVGGGAVEGTTFGADYFVGAASALNQGFVKAFKAKYKHEPDSFAALGYTAMYLAAQAIKNAGPTPTRESVREALAKTRNMPTVLGTGMFSFDEGRNANYGAAVLTVKDGKFVPADKR
jgi:branched-chain amino acid transport system substrate-binding protein